MVERAATYSAPATRFVHFSLKGYVLDAVDLDSAAQRVPGMSDRRGNLFKLGQTQLELEGKEIRGVHHMDYDHTDNLYKVVLRCGHRVTTWIEDGGFQVRKATAHGIDACCSDKGIR